MTYYLRRNAASQWRWCLRAVNNRIIAESGEAYYNREDCIAAIRLMQGSGAAPIKDE